MNYWEPIDGVDDELAAASDGTSIVVQEQFPSARVVKSLNQIGYHELDEGRRPQGAPDRIALGVAGDDRVAVRAVMRLIDLLGFDAVDAGPLEHGLDVGTGSGTTDSVCMTGSLQAARQAPPQGFPAGRRESTRDVRRVHGHRSRRRRSANLSTSPAVGPAIITTAYLSSSSPATGPTARRHSRRWSPTSPTSRTRWP